MNFRWWIIWLIGFFVIFILLTVIILIMPWFIEGFVFPYFAWVDQVLKSLGYP